MISKINLWAFVVGILCLVCQQRGQSSNTLQEDIASINALRFLDEQAAEASNVEAMLANRAENYVSKPPDKPVIHGKSAARQRLIDVFSQSDLEEEFISKEIVVDGNSGYERGIFTATLHQKDRGDSVLVTGSYVWILERQEDGSWKYVSQMWSKDTLRN